MEATIGEEEVWPLPVGVTGGSFVLDILVFRSAADTGGGLIEPASGIEILHVVRLANTGRAWTIEWYPMLDLLMLG